MSSINTSGFMALTPVTSLTDSSSAVSEKTSRSSSLSTFEGEREANKLAMARKSANKNADWTHAKDGGVWLRLTRARDN